MEPKPYCRPRESFLVKGMAKLTGFSYTSLFLLWLSMSLAFGAAYFLLGYVPGDHGTTIPKDMDFWSRLLNSFYYSVITATSTGYGDITPLGFSKFLAVIQTASALMVFATFVAKLVAHRQEVALEEVHKLTFEDIFHNTREDLFVIRRDFDAAIREAQEYHTVSEHTWENLCTAFEHAAILTEEIPEFYDGPSRLYTIDARREELLIEALKRTLHRLNHMLDVFSKENIDWISQKPVMDALMVLVQIVGQTMPRWSADSPHKKEEAFADILLVTDSVQKRIAGELPMKENQ